jgi:hypothetical protein
MTITKWVGRGAARQKLVLTDLAMWEQHAGPKRPGQWQDRFSAKESAMAWLKALPHLPPEIVTLLGTHPAFGTVESWTAEPEAQLRFDDHGGPRNSDLLVDAIDEHGRFHLAVEAKVRESFGETVERALTVAQARLRKIPESKGETRVNELCERYLSAKPLDADVRDLRYQLLTATAGAVQEALRAGVQRTVFLVHEFIKPPSTHGAYTANARDFDAFISRLTRESVRQVPPGRLVEIPLPVAATNERSLRFFVGKASRVLAPKDSGDVPTTAHV